MTSIGGRIVEIVPTIGLRLATGRGAEARRVSEVEGPSAIWAGGSIDAAGADADAASAADAPSLWVVRTGASIGRGVVEVFRGTIAAPPTPSATPTVEWNRTRTLLFGQSLQATVVPVVAFGPVGAIGPDALHVVWVARVGDSDDLGYERVPR
jgi:hypothetical protein